MARFERPTTGIKYDFLLRAYFGTKCPVESSIDRAYLDLCRTIRGIAKFPGRSAAHAEAKNVVQSFLIELKSPPSGGWIQAEFDKRHEDACEKICLIYKDAGFTDWTNANRRVFRAKNIETLADSVRIGQAQKWLNMSLKYVYVFGEERIPGYESVFNFAHVPLDNIIMDALVLEPFNVPPLPCAWSKIDGYDVYLKVQEDIRSTTTPDAPLSLEFAIWHLGKATSGVKRLS